MTNWTFANQITVLEGDDCGSLTCVAYDSSLATTAVVEWVPKAGVMYYIAVQGLGDERGDFELTLFAVENVVKNYQFSFWG